MSNEPKQTAHPIEAGTLALVTKDVPSTDNERALPAGKLIEIEDYVSAEESEDGRAFYWASSHGTGNINDVTVYEEFVEVHKTLEQMLSRRIPTVEEVQDFLGSALLDDSDTFEITETDRDGDSGLEIAGQTHGGLRFAVGIQITTIYQADF